jgi:hypothetical protein
LFKIKHIISMDKKLILLYSNFSPACTQLSQNIPPPIQDMLHPINIDHPKMRSMIKASNNVQVIDVPCLLESREGGTIAKYEGKQCWEAITNLYKSLQVANVVQQPRQRRPPATRELEPLDDSEDQQGTQGRNGSIHLPERHPDIGNKRRPFEPMSEVESGNEVHPQQRFERPPRGEGHHGMRSSLPELSGAGSEEMDDDPSGSGGDIPVQQGPRINRAADQRKKAIKDLAESLLSARENEEKEYEAQRKGEFRPKNKTKARVIEEVDDE